MYHKGGENMTKKKLAIIISISTFILGVICFIVLPDVIAVQWSTSGEITNTLSKYAAVLITYAVTAFFLILSWFTENRVSMFSGIRAKAEKTMSICFLWLGFIGIILQAVLLFMNI